MCDLLRTATMLAMLLILVTSTYAEIRKVHSIRRRSDVLDNSIMSDNEIESTTSDLRNTRNYVPSQIVNRDLMDKMSWKCANNASCLYALVNGVYQSYKRGETVKLGPFDLVKLPTTNSDKNKSKSKHKYDFVGSGRGMSTFIDFIRGNSIRVPVGPMVFSIQRAEDDSNYIEVALLKKAVNTGRNQGTGKTGGNGGGGGGGLLGGSGSGGGGGLLSGLGGGSGGGGTGMGIGGGSGGGGGGGIGGRRRKQHQDKKQFQMYIPLYLAATTFGWTMVAAKAVGLLTLKALVISKLAFVVTAMIIVKKLMDNASEKLMYQYPEHAPFMMPYNMDYPMHSMGGEMATNEMFHPSALQLAAASPVQHQGHPSLESFGAESHLHHNIAEVQNNTQVLAALNAVGLGQKVKREDAWIAKKGKQTNYRENLINYTQGTSYVPPNDDLVIAAALAAVEDTAEAESDNDDDVFNSEENIKETLEFFGFYIQRKKK